MKRTIININEDLCNGCGNCVNGCHEGALRLIDGKAIMISDLYCDGLGACIGECPVGAITLDEREAEPYNEVAVMERLVPKGESVILAHLKHLQDHNEMEWVKQGIDYMTENNIKINLEKIGIDPHGNIIENSTLISNRISDLNHKERQEKEQEQERQTQKEKEQKQEPTESKEPLACGCPGSMARQINRNPIGVPHSVTPQRSELSHFPVQLHLINPEAGFFNGADMLLAADCTAFASGEFHSRFLKNKVLAIACPKLDSNTQIYIDKLASLIDEAGINTLTLLIMEVPCCGGLQRIAQLARSQAKRTIPLKVIILSVNGDVKREEWI